MRHWITSYALLLQWTALRKKYYLPLNLIVQVGLAVGIVVGFSYLMPQVDSATALYLTSGAPVMGLVTVGMVIAPQEIAQSKLEGAFEFNRSLPVPRSALMAADATVSIATAFPGLVAGLVVARLHFHLDFRVSVFAAPGFLLIALCAIGVGYGISYALSPAATSLVCQATVFVALMFSPINFPADRLPEWLAAVHQVLPFLYMAKISRETLFSSTGGPDVVSFAVLAVWCALGLVFSIRVMSRRH
ncbi:ABC transporter permease [Streptomyces sp. ADI93-02]|uniref:ABC transporter permease n=1 Tax=Streptomyces sp. ADI93-02 TaxID=1522757 RepID=UPI000F55957A|nr:ABC transporter permease [Streptomyces sp. ADI93-02]RPK40890.1 ABC-2 type transporter [Streptomyces sp. ADI93-02]